MTRLLISTGEVSGDLQGGLLVTALRREAERRGMDLEIVALGGERMERAGARLLANTAPMGAIGLLGRPCPDLAHPAAATAGGSLAR
jgi:lipid-A-disaccharide synthase